MTKQKKVVHTWGETDAVKRFRSKGDFGVHALTGQELIKGQVYEIPENQAGKKIFEPVKDSPDDMGVPAAAKAKEAR